MERLNNVNDDPRFQSYMSAEEDDRKMLNTYIDKAEKAFDKGLEQGIAQGLEQGIEQGIEQSMTNFCFKLKDKGFSNEEISKMLDIDINKLDKILD